MIGRDDFEHEDWVATMPDCFVCDGTLVVLGTLGTLKWTRCRDCGQEQST